MKPLTRSCRWCQANPEKFTIFVESGNIETTGETPSFVYRYQMVMFVMDYAGELDDLTLPLLAWLSENQPQLLLNPGVIRTSNSPPLSMTMTAPISCLRSLCGNAFASRAAVRGHPQAEHLPEPKPRLPSSEGDWSHVFRM